MKFVETHHYSWKIEMFPGIHLQFSSKHLFFVSFSPITPPGKPPTWFPGEELVTQAQICAIFYIFVSLVFMFLLSHFWLKCLFKLLIFHQKCCLNISLCYRNLADIILYHFWNFQNLILNLVIFENFAWDRFLQKTYYFIWKFAWNLAKHIKPNENRNS